MIEPSKHQRRPAPPALALALRLRLRLSLSLLALVLAASPGQAARPLSTGVASVNDPGECEQGLGRQQLHLDVSRGREHRDEPGRLWELGLRVEF